MTLSAVVLTNDSAGVVSDCLQSLKFCDEMVVVDSGSSDDTVKIAARLGAKTVGKKMTGFAAQRNFGFGQARGDWVLLVDSDERVPAALAAEIQAAIKSGVHSAYRMKRQNYFYGRKIRHGGYWPDWQTRLFKKADFKRYTGRIHESPHFAGSLGSLKNHLDHYSHQSLSQGLIKSAAWTQLEAREFIKAGHPPVTWWRLIKVMVWEFCYRYFKKLGFLDGYVGFSESLIQAMNRFFVYQQIWELQQPK